ncbi:zinc-ribbon domain-containing protein [Roseomonas sp. GCM10028921]
MRVACPECAAEYDLPPALATRLGEGRTVRCARCGTTWVPGPLPVASAQPAAEAAEAAPAGAPPPPAPRREEPVRPAVGRGAEPPSPAFPASLLSPAPSPLPVFVPGAPPVVRESPAPLLVAAWGASVLVLAGAAAAAWYWRVDLVEAWPPAARAFIALGLAG